MRKPWMVVRWVHRGVYANYAVEETTSAAAVREELGPTGCIVSKHATEKEAMDIVAGRGPCTCKRSSSTRVMDLDCPACAVARKSGGGF